MLNKDDRYGFTLVEVIVVIAIIGILSTIAIPTYLRWLPNMHLKAAARDIYSAIQKTRIEAIKNNTDMALVFDTANNTYSLCSDPGIDTLWNTLADNTVVEVNDFAQAKYGIGYGNGGIAGITPVTGGPFPADNVSYTNNVLVLNSRGTGNGGYVYLQNQNNSVYAVGTRTSGTVQLRRWIGGGWE